MSTTPKVPDVDPNDKDAQRAAEQMQTTLDNVQEGYGKSSDPAHDNPAGPSDQEGPSHRQGPPQ